MAEEFFQVLVDCMAREGKRHPGRPIAPEVLEAFMNDAVGRPRKAVAPEPAIPPPVASESVASAVPAPGAELDSTPVSACPSLEVLGAMVRDCRRCALAATRHNTVFGEGNPHAKLMFIGEGPGYDEDMQGRPFVGRAGKLLDRMIAAMQFTREEVYIANVVKCRPPQNRTPYPDEAASCIGYLKRQIELIRPEVIVLLGATAVGFLLEKQGGITKLRGKWLGYNGIPVMPTFHPAYLLRQESAKRDAWNDLQQVMKVFGKVYRRK